MRLAPTALAALTLASAAAPAWAQTTPSADAAFRATTLNLSATGEMRLAPDKASFSVGVTISATTARDASQKNAAQMARVVAALKAGGLDARDLQTQRLSLSPQYVYAEGQTPRVTGYQASNSSAVTVRDLARLSSVLDAVAAAGATDVGGVNFGLSDPQAAEDAARRDAVNKLTAKATLYAGAEGLRVGRLVNLAETGGYTPELPRAMMMLARAKTDASTPVEAGEIVVRIEVSAVYELAR